MEATGGCCCCWGMTGGWGWGGTTTDGGALPDSAMTTSPGFMTEVDMVMDEERWMEVGGGTFMKGGN